MLSVVKAENERLDTKRDILKQQIELFVPEKENLEKEKTLLAEKYAKLDGEYKEKSQKLEAKHEKEILMLKEELKEREKEQDKLIALRGKKEMNIEVTQKTFSAPADRVGNEDKSGFQNAVEALTQYIETLPKVKEQYEYTFEDWYNKGVGESYHGRFDKAISSFTNALSKESTNNDKAYAYNFRGGMYVKKDKDKEALADYEESIKYRWGNPRPHYNMANIYLRQDRIDKAEEEIKILYDILEEGKFVVDEEAFTKKNIKLLEKELGERKGTAK